MREAIQPSASPEAPTAAVPEWISGDVGEVLNSEVFPDRDVLFGWGEAHEYGPTGECRLGLYPEHQTLVYEDPQVYLVIKKPSRVTLTEAAVFVDTPGETQESFFAFERDGGFSFTAKAKQLALDQLNGECMGDPSEIPALSERALAVEPITEAPTETLVSEVTAPWEVEGSLGRPETNERPEDGERIARNPVSPGIRESSESLEGSSEPEDRELNGGDTENRSKSVVESKSPVSAPSIEPRTKKTRVDINGRIGRLPTFKTTQRGKRMARFPLAEHSTNAEGEDVTNWHTVAVFNAVADRLEKLIQEGELAVGDELRVAAYPQVQHIPDRNGELKAHEVLFAAHVGKVKQKEPKAR